MASTAPRSLCARRLATADEGTPLCLHQCEGAIQAGRFVAEHANFDLDTMGAQLTNAPAADQGIRVGHGRHHATDAGFDDPLGARTGTPVMAARLERHIHRRAVRVGTRVLQRKHLGVRLAGPRVPSLPHHHTVAAHHHGAHQWVGRRYALGPSRMEQRAPHVLGVTHHFSWKMAST